MEYHRNHKSFFPFLVTSKVLFASLHLWSASGGIFFQQSTSFLKALSSSVHELCFDEVHHRHLAKKQLSDGQNFPCIVSAIWTSQDSKYQTC